jgi:hypothetical protein
MPIRCLAISAIFVLSLPTLGFALEDPVNVDNVLATKLGMIVRAKAAGPDAVAVELEFPTTGDLKGYTGTSVEIKSGKKLIFFTTLRDVPSQPDHVIVSFYLDRARIPETTLKVTARGDALTRVGYILALKDFVDLDKVR